MILRSEPRRPESAGFTLIEMLVVLLVLALAAGLVALHRSGRSRGLEGRSEALAIAETLRAVRGQAIAQARALPVAISAEGHGLLVSGQLARAVAAPFVMEGRAGLAFLPDGSATGNGMALIDQAARWWIGIAPRSGRVTVTLAP